jgi:hypothetical protein
VGDATTPYLTLGSTIIVQKSEKSLSGLAEMEKGSQPTDGGYLLLSPEEAREAVSQHGVNRAFIRPFYGSQEFIQGGERRCIWIEPGEYAEARNNVWLESRFVSVSRMRLGSPKTTTQRLAAEPFRFGKLRPTNASLIAIAAVSSENREYLPCGLLPQRTVISNKCFALFGDAPLWNMALIASRLHWVWIGTVCVRMRTDFSYSNTLGWNTFPVPALTEQGKADLTRCAEDILLAREAHFPATIADLYNPEAMPENLRAAHDRNDETLERIYIGRRFKNDTERLETLFAMYAKMIAEGPTTKATAKKTRAKKVQA